MEFMNIQTPKRGTTKSVEGQFLWIARYTFYYITHDEQHIRYFKILSKNTGTFFHPNLLKYYQYAADIQMVETRILGKLFYI